MQAGTRQRAEGLVRVVRPPGPVPRPVALLLLCSVLAVASITAAVTGALGDVLVLHAMWARVVFAAIGLAFAYPLLRRLRSGDALPLYIQSQESLASPEWQRKLARVRVAGRLLLLIAVWWMFLGTAPDVLKNAIEIRAEWLRVVLVVVGVLVGLLGFLLQTPTRVTTEEQVGEPLAGP